jgi:hypothetical protein
VIPETPEPATIEGFQRSIQRLAAAADEQRKAIAKLRRDIPTDEKMVILDAKIGRLSDHAQLCLTKGAVFTELEIMLRDAPLAKRSEMFQALAWCWDNMPPEVWRKLHIGSLDVCLHKLITTFRERKQ